METPDSWSAIMGLLEAGPADGDEFPSALASRLDQRENEALKAALSVVPAMSPWDLRKWLNLGRVTANPASFSSEAAGYIRHEFAYSITARLKDGEVFDEDTQYAILRLCWSPKLTELEENQIRANAILHESMTLQLRARG